MLAQEAVASVALDGETHPVEAAPPAPHLHNAGPQPVVLSSRFHLGTQFVVYACCTCGMALPERRA
jgi:hypothetical protein